MNINAVMCKGTHAVGHKVALGQVCGFRRVNWGGCRATPAIFCTNRTVRTNSYSSYKFGEDSYSFAQLRTVSHKSVQFRTAKCGCAKICVFLCFSLIFRG
jgi:hypothetical protein